MTRQETGALGEDLAAKDYAADGYTLMERNYRTRLGEIDLIVARGSLLVFAEVKTRAQGAQVSGREAVDQHKQARIVRAAQDYLMTHSPENEPFMRFDVVEVVLRQNEEPEIHRIENAFDV